MKRAHSLFNAMSESGTSAPVPRDRLGPARRAGSVNDDVDAGQSTTASRIDVRLLPNEGMPALRGIGTAKQHSMENRRNV
jgi:hypothetical protein